MKDIDTTQLEQLLIEARGEGYDSSNIRTLETNVSEEAFEAAPGVKPYSEVLDERYGKGNWARFRGADTQPDHWDIIAYIEPVNEAASPEPEVEGEPGIDPQDVLWSKSAGGRTLTLLRGGLYKDKEEK